MTCIRCASVSLKSYGHRVYCLMCGLTWHRTAATVDEEIARRAAGLAFFVGQRLIEMRRRETA